MPSNRGVVYVEPGKVEVQSMAYPKLKMPASETHPFGGKDAPHGVILKLVTTTFETQTTLDVNGVKLELSYKGQNHCEGNICIYAPKQKVLAAIDIISPGWTPYKNCDASESFRGFQPRLARS